MTRRTGLDSLRLLRDSMQVRDNTPIRYMPGLSTVTDFLMHWKGGKPS